MTTEQEVLELRKQAALVELATAQCRRETALMERQLVREAQSAQLGLVSAINESGGARFDLPNASAEEFQEQLCRAHLLASETP